MSQAGGTVGVLHPGSMGVTVAAALRAAGQRALWASQGRSRETRERARAAGLEDAGSLAQLVASSELIVSVCPPAAAEELARQVAQLGFAGVYVNANAVAPERTLRIGEIVRAAGASFVDGSLIGPPATRAGTTRLYVSGKGSEEIAARFAGSLLEVRALGGELGDASALKMTYAAYTKGHVALIAAIQATARSYGVSGALQAEWALSLPELAAQAAASLPGVAPKAWRFAGEMEEIAQTFRGAGLPGGFHDAAAEVYHRLAGFKGASAPPLEDILAALGRGAPGKP